MVYLLLCNSLLYHPPSRIYSACAGDAYRGPESGDLGNNVFHIQYYGITYKAS